MKKIFLYLGILLIGIMTSSNSCVEEGEWLEFDEAKKGEYLASRYVEDSTKMHLTPVASVQEYLKGVGVKAKKVSILDSGGISCACSKRKNGICLCKLPNNKRHECKTKNRNDEHICTREKYIRVFVETWDVDKVKTLGFQ